MLPLTPKQLSKGTVENVADQLRQLDQAEPERAQIAAHEIAKGAVAQHTQGGGFSPADEAKLRAQALTGAQRVLAAQETPGAVLDLVDVVARQAEQSAEIQERVG